MPAPEFRLIQTFLHVLSEEFPYFPTSSFMHLKDIFLNPAYLGKLH